jgi:hypothetical protein
MCRRDSSACPRDAGTLKEGSVAEKSEEQGFVETKKLAAYAPTGGKKTLQIGYLIDLVGAENVGIISCERGLNTIRSKVDDRYVRRVASRPELREAWAWANETFNTPDQWVCVDGGTRVLNWVQAEIFGGAQKALEEILGGTKRLELKPEDRKYAPFVTKELDLNTQQMWIQTGFQCERLLDSFVKLGCNMYWTFWEERTSIDQYTKGPPAIPDTPGKGALSALKGVFDFIFRLVPDGETVTAQFRNAKGSNAIYGKTRDDWDGGIKVPDSIAGFRLDEFVKLISGNKE